MRFLIITYDEYFNIPYIENYEREINRQGHTYDIVLWNRSEQNIVSQNNHFVFFAKDSARKIEKVIPFLRWRNFVLQVLKKGTYDGLIVVTTLPGVLLFDKLIWKYRGKYWFDIRDYTYEYISVFRKLVGKLVNHSMITSISSEGFRTFLPETSNIVLTHNITNGSKENTECGMDITKKPITIGFVGGIQYADQNKQLLDQFSNHLRYRLRYVGKPHLGCDLEAFCQEKNINNVDFFPAYRNEEKPEIYRSIDIINCVYGSNTEIVKLALPNKLYDCILFKKPMIVSKGTYLADIVTKYCLGIQVDVEKDNVVEMLDDYLLNFDRDAFEKGCNEFLQKVKCENVGFQQALNQFCSGDIFYEFN